MLARTFIFTFRAQQINRQTNDIIYPSQFSPFSSKAKTWMNPIGRRGLSINLGGGKCKWEVSARIEKGSNFMN